MKVRKPKRVLINTPEKLKKLAEKMREIGEFAFDTETNSLKVYGYNKFLIVVGVSISWGYKNTYYIPMNHRYDPSPQVTVKEFVQYMKPIFERTDITLVGLNIKR